MCTVEVRWLERCDGGWRLAPDASEKIKYGSLIKEEEAGPPMSNHGEARGA